jgi:hypothetical protein
LSSLSLNRDKAASNHVSLKAMTASNARDAARTAEKPRRHHKFERAFDFGILRSAQNETTARDRQSTAKGNKPG